MNDAQETKMRRTAKDSVFADLFSDPKYLLQLYQALHPEDAAASEKDITDVTIKEVLADHQYNDLGFLVGNTLLVLLEAQSTWSPNIVIRILMYLMRTYSDYCTKNGLDLYSGSRVELPKPELYVIYTGERRDKPEYLTLKDGIFGGQDVCVDARVKVIYDGRHGDIIHQYVTFAKVATEQAKKYDWSHKAVEETIRICMDENVLAEYLQERRVEVMDIMTALFDQEEVTRRYHARIRREIKAEMEAKVKANARAMLADGVPVANVAKWTGLDVKEVEALAKI